MTDMEKTIAALEKLEKVYADSVKKRMKDKNIKEAVRLNWKKDAVKHAIQVVKQL